MYKIYVFYSLFYAIVNLFEVNKLLKIIYSSAENFIQVRNRLLVVSCCSLSVSSSVGDPV